MLMAPVIPSRASPDRHKLHSSRAAKVDMAKPRPEKSSPERRVLPMELQAGDRLTDETGEYEVIGRPYTTNAGKDVHVRVQKIGQPEITQIRTWAAHERVAVIQG